MQKFVFVFLKLKLFFHVYIFQKVHKVFLFQNKKVYNHVTAPP